MRWTIANKLFLALLLTSLVILALTAVLSRLSFERGFLGYLTEQDTRLLQDLARGFEAQYERDGDWRALRDPKRWPELLRRASPGPGPEPDGRPRGARSRPGGTPFRGDDLHGPRGPDRGGPRKEPPGIDPLQIRSRTALYDNQGRLLGGPQLPGSTWETVPIVVEGEQVGELRMAPATQLTAEVDVRFADQQARSFLVIALVVLVFAIGASLLLSKQLTRPIQSLARGTRAMTSGDYDERITVAGDDELGALAKDFNELASTLDRNRQLRRQWIADVSHELRTPLAILTGELQAIEDGVRDFSDGTRQSLQAEVDRLNRLVHDLYELSSSDEGGLVYRRAPVDVGQLIRETAGMAAARLEAAGIQLHLNVDSEPMVVSADSTRLQQLFTNLIENSVRYTDSPGSLTISAHLEQSNAVLVFSDSAPGVPPDLLPRIFDRLYRVDPSRSRTTGGSGLGLSISRAIVEAHGGEISASPSEDGGLSIRVCLPAEPRIRS